MCKNKWISESPAGHLPACRSPEHGWRHWAEAQEQPQAPLGAGVWEGRQNHCHSRRNPCHCHHFRQDFWSSFINKQLISLNKIWTKPLWNFMNKIPGEVQGRTSDKLYRTQFDCKMCCWLDWSKTYFFFLILENGTPNSTLICIAVFSTQWYAWCIPFVFTRSVSINGNRIRMHKDFCYWISIEIF